MVTCYGCENDKACVWVKIKIGKVESYAAVCKDCARKMGEKE
jgi:protein-arginine kinase activator protein McsA